MYKRKTKQDLKRLNQSFNESQILSSDFTPITFDPKLTSNPFMREQEKFHFLVYKVKEYNKQVLNKQVDDKYQTMVYAKLFTLISNLSNIDIREDQVARLAEIHEWFLKQDRLLNQRKDQGDIRYKVMSHEQVENASVVPGIKKQKNPVSIKPEDMLPSEYLRKQSLPFQRNWRTTHKELETPDQRIKEFKRKMINLQPISDTKDVKKAPRIVYPKLGRYTWVREFQIEENAQIDGEQANVQNPESVIENGDNKEGDNKEGENKEGEKPAENEQQPEQDLGLGEPADEEPEEQEEQEEIDKLAPRFKSYIFEGRAEDPSEKFSHSKMNERYLKLQHKSIMKQSEEGQFVKMMHDWGMRKSLIDKDIMRRIEDMGVSPRYSFSYEEPQPEEKIKPEDEKKFGLSKTMPMKPLKPNLDLSSDFTLPSIANNRNKFQKTIKKDRLKSLKSKFGQMLNLKQVQYRENPESLCKSVPKRFSISDILEKHSKDKERLNQLDEAISLKEKLAGSKINIDVKTLSMSMCAPEDEENLPVNCFPAKDLPSNPFWVEPAKKKKKKK